MQQNMSGEQQLFASKELRQLVTQRQLFGKTLINIIAQIVNLKNSSIVDQTLYNALYFQNRPGSF